MTASGASCGTLLAEFRPTVTEVPDHQRRAGVLIPLFSCRSTASWGVGDIGDLVPTAAYLAAAGQRVVQLLPLNEMAPGEQSPYSAISAMAIDPIYIRLPAVEEFETLGGENALPPADRRRLDRAAAAPQVSYADVRYLKRTALAAAFDRFWDCEWKRDTERAGSLRAFVAAQAWWVEDYALFRAIRAHHDERPWHEWPQPLQRRDGEALDRARRDYARDVAFFQYVQWQADSQWRKAREALGAIGVEVLGDLPFMVDGDSADVWARPGCFRIDVSTGVPPDAFSAAGQDWGMPLYDWPAMGANDYQWLRERARRGADLFDGYRVDHLVGFYRTYGRPRAGGDPFFSPADEPEQLELGERVLAIFREPGSRVVAEDLGTVPDFVRASIARLGVPGFRVLRWERQWHDEGQPFRDPAEYPPASVATSGTHDTEPMAIWWRRTTERERGEISLLPTVRAISGDRDLVTEPYLPVVRDTLLESLFASGSNLIVIPVQDLFGWPDRINEPATVSSSNWTFRLPWPIDRWHDVPEARERQATLRVWAERHRRL
jgi:4-alpha-glucanotransferase